MTSVEMADAKIARFARYVILRNSYNIYYRCLGKMREMALVYLCDQRLTLEEDFFLYMRQCSIMNGMKPTYEYQPESFMGLPFDASIHEGTKIIRETFVD